MIFPTFPISQFPLFTYIFHKFPSFRIFHIILIVPVFPISIAFPNSFLPLKFPTLFFFLNFYLFYWQLSCNKSLIDTDNFLPWFSHTIRVDSNHIDRHISSYSHPIPKGFFLLIYYSPM